MSSLKEKEFRARLISQVNVRPALWDKKAPEYKDKSIRDEGWNEISRVLQICPKDCKSRWKNLVDTFRPLLRASKRTLNGNEDIPEKRKVVKWPYFSQMLFLKDVLSKGEAATEVRDEFSPEDILELKMGNDSECNDKAQSDTRKIEKLSRSFRKRKLGRDEYVDEIQETLSIATRALAKRESPVASFTDYLGELLLKLPDNKRRKCQRDLIERVNAYIDGLEDITEEM